jgi:hypothetical protein
MSMSISREPPSTSLTGSLQEWTVEKRIKLKKPIERVEVLSIKVSKASKESVKIFDAVDKILKATHLTKFSDVFKEITAKLKEDFVKQDLDNFNFEIEALNKADSKYQATTNFKVHYSDGSLKNFIIKVNDNSSKSLKFLIKQINEMLSDPNLTGAKLENDIFRQMQETNKQLGHKIYSMEIVTEKSSDFLIKPEGGDDLLEPRKKSIESASRTSKQMVRARALRRAKEPSTPLTEKEKILKVQGKEIVLREREIRLKEKAVLAKEAKIRADLDLDIKNPETAKIKLNFIDQKVALEKEKIAVLNQKIKYFQGQVDQLKIEDEKAQKGLDNPKTRDQDTIKALVVQDKLEKALRSLNLAKKSAEVAIKKQALLEIERIVLADLE